MALMLGGFPAMQKLDNDAARGLVAQYLQLARDRPHWAIVNVCRAIREGKARLSRAFSPSEAEFNSLIRSEVAQYERNLMAAQQLLRAKVQPPPAPKLTDEEIEAKLGRKLHATVEANPAPPAYGDAFRSEPTPAEPAPTESAPAGHLLKSYGQRRAQQNL